MANEGLFFGNAIQGFLLARQMKLDREQRDEEVKARTKLAEIELRKAMDAEAQAKQNEAQAASQKRLNNINRDMIMGEAELGVSTGKHKSLADALADLRLQSDMRRYGFDPEKDFGVQKPTADIQELEYLRAHPEAAQFDLARRRASGTQVNVGTGEAGLGKVPPGYFRPNATAPGLAPEPGGPAAIELSQGASQAKASLVNSTSSLDRMKQAATTLQKNPNLFLGVGLGGLSSKIPGSPGADVAAEIESLQSQVAFSVLQAMREASKTGGALGSVSERELALLESNLAALSTAQSPEAFRKGLQALIDYADAAKARISDAYTATYAKPGLGAAPPSLGPQRDNSGFVVGQEYTDAQGNRAVYLGNGQWKPL